MTEGGIAQELSHFFMAGKIEETKTASHFFGEPKCIVHRAGSPPMIGGKNDFVMVTFRDTKRFEEVVHLERCR